MIADLPAIKATLRAMLAAFIEGCVKNGVGQRDTASNMVRAFNASCAKVRAPLQALEGAQRDRVKE